MGALKDLISALLIDATPAERLKLFRVTFRIVVGVHILWACGWFAVAGYPGFAFAGDVDDKIEAAVKPINSKLAAISGQLDQQAALQKRILTAQIADRLRQLQLLRCKADSFGRERLESDIEAAQQEYRGLTGERYPLALCEL